MAILQLENGKTYRDLSQIARELATLNIKIARRPVGKNLDLPGLLARDVLNHLEKNQVLEAVRGHFEEVKRLAGYQWRDLMVLHPGVPNLFALMVQCDRCHIHTDSEALYILAGECIFGFVRPDGSQLELIVQAEEYINIPMGIEHWFSPTVSLQLKAVRYFTTADGWIPYYTGTKISFHQSVAR